jgi:hypothetical protein
MSGESPIHPKDGWGSRGGEQVRIVRSVRPGRKGRLRASVGRSAIRSSKESKGRRAGSHHGVRKHLG